MQRDVSTQLLVHAIISSPACAAAHIGLASAPRAVQTTRSTVVQVIIVGDLNVAASQQDVHSKYSYDKMYRCAADTASL